MDKELETYYNNYLELFLTEGWKQFIKDVSSNLDTFSINNLNTSEELHSAKGSIKVLTNITNFESIIKNAYEEITNSDSPLEEDD